METYFITIKLLNIVNSSLVWVPVTDRYFVCDPIVPAYYSNVMQPFPTISSLLSGLIPILFNTQKELIVLSKSINNYSQNKMRRLSEMSQTEDDRTKRKVDQKTSFYLSEMF